MINPVLRTGDTANDWPVLRSDIQTRILNSIGTPGKSSRIGSPQIEELDRYFKHDLEHVSIKYHVIDDIWNKAIIVLPSKLDTPAPCILTIHGTTKEGKESQIDPIKRPNRAYGIELAQQGFVTCQPDLYGFGESDWQYFDKTAPDAFFETYPDWSLDGRRILECQRLLDTLATLDYVDAENFGTMGNSLGGRGVVYLSALDERIKAAVSSTGISPNATNTFRSLNVGYTLSPALNEHIMANGNAPWEYQELLALIAPRALLALEPYNDNCNPDVFPTMECLYQAAPVYKLLDAPQNISWYTHGDGHDTVDTVRAFAYAWLKQKLQ